MNIRWMNIRSAFGRSPYLRRTMKAPSITISHVYRPLVGVLAALLLTLPASATWKPLAPMPSARSNAAVETINGIVYVAGGYGGGGGLNLMGVNTRNKNLSSPPTPALP